MKETKAGMKEIAWQMPYDNGGFAAVSPILVESGALKQLPAYVESRSYERVSIVADPITFGIAGELTEKAIQERNIQVRVTLIQANEHGDVVADEASLIQLLLDVKSFASEAIIAVGSGTLHDIARFTSYASGIPFLSVPTAPSVDGFNSIGAPVILRGEKKTIQSVGPAAIFADLDILTKAPSSLIAAGFGDMLGKYTSLFDWKFGNRMGGESYSAQVAEMTENALKLCIANRDEIANRSAIGIEILTRSLLQSGFAMLLFGESHPASGAEHHLSHYWEMAFLKRKRKQLLHGAKVGVACAEISGLYHALADKLSVLLPAEHREAVLQELEKIRMSEPFGNCCAPWEALPRLSNLESMRSCSKEA